MHWVRSLNRRNERLHPMHDRISTPALRRLQLRMRPLLRPAGSYNAARQGQGGGHVGGDSPVRESPAALRNHWFAERSHLGTPLSHDELQHGVREGIISSSLVNE